MQKIILLTCVCLGIIGYFSPNSEIGEYVPQVEIVQTEDIEKYVEKPLLKEDSFYILNRNFGYYKCVRDCGCKENKEEVNTETEIVIE